jgi:hypothetical protein
MTGTKIISVIVFFDYVIVEEGCVGPVRVKVLMFLSVTLRVQG